MNKNILAMLLAILMILASVPVLADDDAHITVQGTAQVTADPDMVSVTANASVRAGTVGGAQEIMNGIIADATKKLMDLGVQADDIVTSEYYYYPSYNYETNTQTGYEANHTLSITCRDAEMLDSVINVLSDCGFAQVNSVRYDVSGRSELYRQALELAVECAQQKAQRLAAAAGMKLTSLDSITENGGYAGEYVVNTMEDAAVMKRAGGVSGIRAGNVTVSASVTVEFKAEK